MDTKQPNIGLALSGASSRAVFYIGFLEVLKEHSIRIDYIAACSSGTIVAAAYACGTMEELKNQIFSLNKETIFGMIGKQKVRGGLYSLDHVEDIFRLYTKNLHFEDVRPLMGFVTVDIEKGEQVVLSMGDIAHAARVSCTLPGIFDPMQWGGRTLIDGGLLSIVPIDVVKAAGMDITIAMNLRGTRHIFTQNQIRMKKAYNMLKRALLIHQAGKYWKQFIKLLEETEFLSYFNNFRDLSEEEPRPSMFSVIGRSLDLAIEATKKDYTYTINPHTDLLIVSDAMKGGINGLGESQYLYDLGRKTAEEYIPKIQDIIQTVSHTKVPQEELKISL